MTSFHPLRQGLGIHRQLSAMWTFRSEEVSKSTAEPLHVQAHLRTVQRKHLRTKSRESRSELPDVGEIKTMHASNLRWYWHYRDLQYSQIQTDGQNLSQLTSWHALLGNDLNPTRSSMSKNALQTTYVAHTGVRASNGPSRTSIQGCGKEQLLHGRSHHFRRDCLSGRLSFNANASRSAWCDVFLVASAHGMFFPKRKLPIAPPTKLKTKCVIVMTRQIERSVVVGNS